MPLAGSTPERCDAIDQISLENYRTFEIQIRLELLQHQLDHVYSPGQGSRDKRGDDLSIVQLQLLKNISIIMSVLFYNAISFVQLKPDLSLGAFRHLPRADRAI